MLPASLSPKGLLSRTSYPRAEHVSIGNEYFSSLIHAIRVDHSNARTMWSQLRTQFAESGYWPLVVSYIVNGAPGSWQQVVQSETGQLFSRFYFEEEVAAKLPGMRSVDPKDIVASANSSDPVREIQRFQQRSYGTAAENAGWICDSVGRTFGVAPRPEQLLRRLSEKSTSPGADLQGLAFDWLQSEGPGLSKTHEPFWYEPKDTLAILLLPISSPSDALAFVHWWGCHTIGTPSVICLLRDWQRQYGAELMCHYGTVLQLSVTTPITSPSDAFHVASQLESICMQHGFVESASGLLGATHWHMHNRP